MPFKLRQNANLFRALLSQISAPNKTGPLKGKHYAQMRAKARAICRTNVASLAEGVPSATLPTLNPTTARNALSGGGV